MLRNSCFGRATTSVAFAGLFALASQVGCTGTPGGGPDADASPGDAATDTATDAPTDAPTDQPSPGCPATTVPCQDQSIQHLGFFDTPNPAGITQVSMANGVFVHEIDATGGGMTPTLAYVYARFTPTGLERVNISDEDAFTSLDWDIAFRRFIIRLNSGVSGPGCVTGGRTAPATMFDALTAVPAGLAFRTEEYLTGSCDLIPDGSGLGSPSTALASFWTYAGCVQMSGNVYVVRPRAGAPVKLQVMSYYSPAAQQQCDTMGTLPNPSGAGHVRVQWARLAP